MLWLPDGENFLLICVFVFTWFTNVTDTRKDRQTPHDDIGRAYIATRGKNWSDNGVGQRGGLTPSVRQWTQTKHRLTLTRIRHTEDGSWMKSINLCVNTCPVRPVSQVRRYGVWYSQQHSGHQTARYCQRYLHTQSNVHWFTRLVTQPRMAE